MTEKRFKLVNGIKKGTHSRIWDNQKQHNQGIGDELWLGEVVDMLNEGVAIVKENEELKKRLSDLQKENYGNIDGIAFYQEENASLCEKISDLECENEELRQENKKILDTINNKITEKGMNWYGAEDNSKEEKEANLQLNVLEEVRDEIKGEWRK